MHNCSFCPAGKASNGSASNCTIAPLGYASPFRGASSFEYCGDNFGFADTVGSTECKACNCKYKWTSFCDPTTGICECKKAVYFPSDDDGGLQYAQEQDITTSYIAGFLLFLFASFIMVPGVFFSGRLAQASEWAREHVDDFAESIKKQVGTPARIHA